MSVLLACDPALYQRRTSRPWFRSGRHRRRADDGLVLAGWQAAAGVTWMMLVAGCCVPGVPGFAVVTVPVAGWLAVTGCGMIRMISADKKRRVQ